MWVLIPTTSFLIAPPTCGASQCRRFAGRQFCWCDAALLERELTVFRQERERIPPKQRPHYTPTHRLEILQITYARRNVGRHRVARADSDSSHGTG